MATKLNALGLCLAARPKSLGSGFASRPKGLSKKKKKQTAISLPPITFSLLERIFVNKGLLFLACLFLWSKLCLGIF